MNDIAKTIPHEDPKEFLAGLDRLSKSNPTTTAALSQPTLAHVAVDKLRPSPTHIQALRRARFDKKTLGELADSIRKVGLLQPIVATPYKKPLTLNPVASDPTHIIVAGERRWLAAKEAGLQTVPVNVRELTEEEVLEVQLIENLQREGLHELEEAEGYEELMKLKKVNAEALADLVGKSRSYVYARVKLLALCPEARKAFYAGELDASKALLVARIGHHDTQRAALKDLAGDKWNGSMSFRQAQEHIQRNYMLRLKEVPFAMDDATLVPKAGTCSACPKRTGNQRELFPDVKDADVCTDPKCFADKKAAHVERQRIAAEKAGKKVITGADAKAIFPSEYRQEPGGGYVGLDTSCLDDPKRRQVRELMAKHPEAVELVQHPTKKDLIEVVRSSTLTEILNERGIKTYRQQVAQSAAKTRKQGAAQKDDEKLQNEVIRQQALAIYKACPAKIGKVHLLHSLERLVDDYGFEAHLELEALLGLPKNDDGGNYAVSVVMKKLEALSEPDLIRAYVTALICDARQGYDAKKGAKLLASVKVDLKKVEAQVRAEAKAAAKPKATPTAAAKKKPAKKAKRK